MDGKRELGKFVQAVQHENDDPTFPKGISPKVNINKTGGVWTYYNVTVQHISHYPTSKKILHYITCASFQAFWEEGPETEHILSWWPQNKHGVKLLGGNENG